MLLAIFSDIHGNLPALESVLQDIKTRGVVDQVYCLGDLVGYAPFPNEVIDRLRQEGIPSIMGNYDQGTGFDLDECGCAYREPEEKRLGDLSFQWTKAHVTLGNKAFLRNLYNDIRFGVSGKHFLLVHGSPRRINEYLFEDRPLSSFQRIEQDARADIIVCGHTHKPYIKEVDGVLFVNVGSVGKPKDGDSRACYGLIEVHDGIVEISFQRVTYNVAAVASAIRESELPAHFADVLERAL